jgi:phosphoglycolate phosphatase-like HAD superfamily hydrolase
VSRRTSSNLLVLFDIDGTLTRRAGSTHRDALVAAVRAILGVETRNDNIPVHGMLDPDILMRMMINAGVSRRQARPALPAICRAAVRYYLENVPDLRRKTCPGVRPLLNRLRRRGAVLGVVSGNLSRIGWKKLACAGLREYFRFGTFADMAATRIELARLALRRAESRGWINGRAPRVLIGDTPNDVEAGRANGIDTIAVATGLSSMGELRASGASLCAPDLADPAVLEWLKARW